MRCFEGYASGYGDLYKKGRLVVCFFFFELLFIIFLSGKKVGKKERKMERANMYYFHTYLYARDMRESACLAHK
jgi:hypothetical protein